MLFIQKVKEVVCSMTVGKGADKRRHYGLAKEKRIFKLLVKDGQGRG